MVSMICQKISICEPIPKKDFSVWHARDAETGRPFTPTNSEITKMRSACEHRPDIAETIFGSEIFNAPQRLCKDSETMYHSAKSEITKRFSEAIINEIPKCG